MRELKCKEILRKDGSTLKLYYIGALSKATGKSVNTIRLWELNGVIPETCFRDSSGARLYSLEQIKIITEAVKKYRPRRGTLIASTLFSNVLRKQLLELYEDYKELLKR